MAVTTTSQPGDIAPSGANYDPTSGKTYDIGSGATLSQGSPDPTYTADVNQENSINWGKTDGTLPSVTPATSPTGAQAGAMASASTTNPAQPATSQSSPTSTGYQPNVSYAQAQQNAHLVSKSALLASVISGSGESLKYPQYPLEREPACIHSKGC